MSPVISLDEYRKRKHVRVTSSHTNSDKTLNTEKKIALGKKLPSYQKIMSNMTQREYSLLDAEQHVALYAYQNARGNNVHAINLTAAIKYGRTTRLYHKFRSIIIHPALSHFSTRDRIAYTCYELEHN